MIAEFGHDKDLLADRLVEYFAASVEGHVEALVTEIGRLANMEDCVTFKRAHAEAVSRWPAKDQWTVSAALEDRIWRLGAR
jgi:hypothetical protein